VVEVGDVEQDALRGVAAGVVVTVVWVEHTLDIVGQPIVAFVKGNPQLLESMSPCNWLPFTHDPQLHVQFGVQTVPHPYNVFNSALVFVPT